MARTRWAVPVVEGRSELRAMASRLAEAWAALTPGFRRPMPRKTRRSALCSTSGHAACRGTQTSTPAGKSNSGRGIPTTGGEVESGAGDSGHGGGGGTEADLASDEAVVAAEAVAPEAMAHHDARRGT